MLVARLLRAEGWEVSTIGELERKGLPDAEQLEYAAANCLTIVTHNRVDFEALAVLYHATGQHHCGIIIAPQRGEYPVARTLHAPRCATRDEIAGQLLNA